MAQSAFPEVDFFRTDSGEPVLRWGILAPGLIAGVFADALQRHTRQRLVAVGSRSAERAERFARDHGADRSYGSYQALVADPEVDVVYVAAPQSEHLTLGLLAIAAGKHVLIEKPMATSAAEGRRLAEAARAAGVLLMEAMWTRYHPQSAVIRALLRDGALGEVKSVSADHGQFIPREAAPRLWDLELGGGALLDLGVYPVQFDSMVLGAPSAVTALGRMTDTGVDAWASVLLSHDSGAQSVVTTSMLARTPTVATIAGTEALLEVGGHFHMPTTLTLSDNQFQGVRQVWQDPTWVRLFDALSWQMNALATFVGEGRTESPLHPLDETVSILATIDEARRQIAEAKP